MFQDKKARRCDRNYIYFNISLTYNILEPTVTPEEK